MIVINIELCNRCLWCIDSCPAEALAMMKKKVVVNSAACLSCGTCIDVCPYGAIEAQANRNRANVESG
jgi:electron transfer flavoprotein alpha subunit